MSVIWLRNAAGEAIQAELWDEIGSQHLHDWSKSWRPALQAAREALEARQVPRELWPQSAHWDWKRKVERTGGLLGARTFCVVAENMTQGLMAVDLTRSARLKEQWGKPLIYVDYLEAAPWNQNGLVGVRRFRGIGLALLTAAIDLSREEGFKGRIGLHALPQADSFYKIVCGMSDLGQDEEYHNLRYFEMTPHQASGFLEEGGGQ